MHHAEHHDASAMRTTLTVDDDLLHLAKQRAATLHLPLVEIINRALRKGLVEDAPSALAEATVVYWAEPGPAPDLTAWTVRLDDEELRRKAGL
jgi:hypothetical protein